MGSLHFIPGSVSLNAKQMAFIIQLPIIAKLARILCLIARAVPILPIASAVDSMAFLIFYTFNVFAGECGWKAAAQISPTVFR